MLAPFASFSREETRGKMRWLRIISPLRYGCGNKGLDIPVSGICSTARWKYVLFLNYSVNTASNLTHVRCCRDMNKSGAKPAP